MAHRKLVERGEEAMPRAEIQDHHGYRRKVHNHCDPYHVDDNYFRSYFHFTDLLFL